MKTHGSRLKKMYFFYELETLTQKSCFIKVLRNLFALASHFETFQNFMTHSDQNEVVFFIFIEFQTLSSFEALINDQKRLKILFKKHFCLVFARFANGLFTREVSR